MSIGSASRTDELDEDGECLFDMDDDKVAREIIRVLGRHMVEKTDYSDDGESWMQIGAALAAGNFIINRPAGQMGIGIDVPRGTYERGQFEGGRRLLTFAGDGFSLSIGQAP